MFKEKKKKALLTYYHLQVTLQKGSLYDYRASSPLFRIIGSFSNLVINNVLERAYILKALQTRQKHFVGT